MLPCLLFITLINLESSHKIHSLKMVKWHNTESAVVIEQTDDRAIQLRGVIVCSTQRMTKTLNNFTSETQFSLSLKLITFGEREVTVSCQDYWG